MQGYRFTLLNDRNVVIFPDNIIRIWEDDVEEHDIRVKIKDITGEVITIQESFSQVLDQLCKPRNIVDTNVFGSLKIENTVLHCDDIDPRKFR